MLKRLFIILSMMVLSVAANAANDSTKIRIQVEIKGQQRCDYSYSSKGSLLARSNFNNCAVISSQLTEEISPVLLKKQTNPTAKGLRVVMVAQ